MAKTETSFTRMDESTAEQWAVIGAETFKNQPRVADAFLSMLRQLEGITDGFATNQLVHSLQTATRAERAGADDEVVVASLCHDMGKIVSVFNHPAIAAEILRPYVRSEVYDMIRTHQENKAIATIAALPVAEREATACGIMRIDASGRVIDFVEKPKTREALDKVATEMVESRRSSLLVVDGKGRPLGRILSDDVLDALVPGHGRLHFPRILQ